MTSIFVDAMFVGNWNAGCFGGPRVWSSAFVCFYAAILFQNVDVGMQVFHVSLRDE